MVVSKGPPRLSRFKASKNKNVLNFRGAYYTMVQISTSKECSMPTAEL